MKHNTWRDLCSPIIAKVLKEHKGETEKEIRKALYHAYPFGERARHPYKIWCDEINKQLGTKPARRVLVNKDQLDMFN